MKGGTKVPLFFCVYSGVEKIVRGQSPTASGRGVRSQLDFPRPQTVKWF